ncbi:MAG: hypothetical protein COU08_02740 [Candidatus Harrisonbacteria bacterium CG10_big_fil_rev_8_21_14_0_10_42_17]|uniref:Uncharacterized protein n=1 Tax=Candidatus Harrisonbacteria bacterium CG10_big_fil_rev_8_21_14_0_10_42_17 TaxID=1974584 RepID=A0A2M6WHX0_9BACT|nr:MAG: hypothetical protein COU08_02740 [Candidatus Harrisonbacteria bacterium CG10_big_fil_rev_8_21_14_0_10_42_17]
MAEVEVDRSRFKIIVIGIVAFIAALGFGYQLSKIPTHLTGGVIVSAVLTGMIWLVFVLLQTFLVKSPTIGAQLLATQALAVLLPSYKALSLLISAAGIILFVFMYVGFLRGRSNILNFIKIKFFKISAHTISLFVTGIAIFVAMYFVNSVDISELPFSQKTFDSVLDTVTPLIRRAVPEFAPDVTVYEVLESIAISELPENVPPETVQSGVNQLKGGFEKKYGIVLNENDTVRNSLYENLIVKIQSLESTQARTIALAAIGLIVFLSIKGFAFFISWIIILIAYIVFKILQTTNFFYIGLEDRQKESIVVK